MGTRSLSLHLLPLPVAFGVSFALSCNLHLVLVSRREDDGHVDYVGVKVVLWLLLDVECLLRQGDGQLDERAF